MLLTTQSKVKGQENCKDKQQTASKGIKKYTNKLIQVQKLMYEVQSTLNDCNERSYELTSQNKKIAEENQKLKEKIKQIEQSHKIKQTEGKISGNTSQRTQESEWFKSVDSFNQDFEDSADSIMILNDQIEHIKELKALEVRDRSLYMHRKTNSIDRSARFEECVKKNKWKEYREDWKTQAIGFGRVRKWKSEGHFTQKLVESAMVCSILGLRFN